MSTSPSSSSSSTSSTSPPSPPAARPYMSRGVALNSSSLRIGGLGRHMMLPVMMDRLPGLDDTADASADTTNKTPRRNGEGEAASLSPRDGTSGAGAAIAKDVDTAAVLAAEGGAEPGDAASDSRDTADDASESAPDAADGATVATNGAPGPRSANLDGDDDDAYIRRHMGSDAGPPPVDMWEDEGTWVVGDADPVPTVGNALAEAPRLDVDFVHALIAWWEERDITPATAAELLPVLTPASPVLIALLFRLGAPTTAPDPEGARDLLLGLLSTYIRCPCDQCGATRAEPGAEQRGGGGGGGNWGQPLADAPWVTTDRTVFFLRSLVRYYSAVAGTAPWPARAAAERAFGYLGRALGHTFDARADIDASRPSSVADRRARFRELAGSIALYDVHRHEAHALRWFDADPAGVARDLHDAFLWLRSTRRAAPACVLARSAREAAARLGRFMPARVVEVDECAGAHAADLPAALSDDCTLVFADAHAPRRGQHARAYTAALFTTLAPHTMHAPHAEWATFRAEGGQLGEAAADAVRRLRRNLRMTNARGRVSVALDAGASPGPAWMMAARRRNEDPDPPRTLTGNDLADAAMLYCEISAASKCEGAGIAAALALSPPSAE